MSGTGAAMSKTPSNRTRARIIELEGKEKADTALLEACRAAFRIAILGVWRGGGVTPEAAQEAIMNVVPRLDERLGEK